MVCSTNSSELLDEKLSSEEEPASMSGASGRGGTKGGITLSMLKRGSNGFGAILGKLTVREIRCPGNKTAIDYFVKKTRMVVWNA